MLGVICFEKGRAVGLPGGFGIDSLERLNDGILEAPERSLLKYKQGD